MYGRESRLHGEALVESLLVPAAVPGRGTTRCAKLQPDSRPIRRKSFSRVEEIVKAAAPAHT